jgi:Carboxypeptidase regulatory-like domain
LPGVAEAAATAEPTHAASAPAAARSRARTRAAVGATAAALVAAVATLAWMLGGPSAYTVRVSVLDAEGRTVAHAKITASVGGEVLPSADGGQILIPASSKPADGKVVVRASVPEAFEQGETEIQLQGRSPITAIVRLQKPTNAHIRGTVVDSAQQALLGVRVTIVGVEGQAVTKADGSFSLPAHAADGQQVQLRAEKDGYQPTLMWHPAGDAPALLILR